MRSLFLSLVFMSSAVLIGQGPYDQAPFPEHFQPTQAGMLDYRPQPARSFTLEFSESSYPRSCSYSASGKFFSLNFLANSSTLICRGKPERIQIIRHKESSSSPKELTEQLERRGFHPLPSSTAIFVNDYLQVLGKNDPQAKQSQLCFLLQDTATRDQWIITLTGDLQFKAYVNET